jgi:hypothetical protein
MVRSPCPVYPTFISGKITVFRNLKGYPRYVSVMDSKGLNPLTRFHARSARFPQAFYLIRPTKYCIHHWRYPNAWLRQWVQAYGLPYNGFCWQPMSCRFVPVKLTGNFFTV